MATLGTTGFLAVSRRSARDRGTVVAIIGLPSELSSDADAQTAVGASAPAASKTDDRSRIIFVACPPRWEL